ncbi:MAG: peptidyl-prolyl cis-trans isomerase cyclophilin type [Gemmatimonadetes bacterium]|nr:peptidyl-prolyl cis-trans isomerase cyclophilin type [Gemmatimonadota bacterium]
MRAAWLFAVAFIALACSSKPAVNVPASSTPAPDSFLVVLETSRGPVTVKVNRAWAPHGADRLHDLVTSGFLSENRFFRVVPGFIAQFGLNDDRATNEAWDARSIEDDPFSHSNEHGTLVFAQNGPNTRSHQLFFNIGANQRLDAQKFTPVGRVVSGANAMDSIYSAYEERPDQHLIRTLGNSYLARMFPKLDYVRSARVEAFPPK